MSLTYPSFLYFLSLVSIPILLHLWSIKRAKQEFFSNVALLKKIQIVSSKSSRIKHILLLLSRICFVVFITLAFAKFYSSSIPNHAPLNAIDIKIDKSCSVMASEENIAQISKVLSPRTADPSPSNTLLDPDFDCHVNSSSLSDLLDRRRTGSQRFAQTAVISDFQWEFVDLDKLKNNGGETYLVCLNPKNVRSNIDVDSIWLVDAYLKKNGGANQVAVRLRNSGEKAADLVRVEFKVENTTIASQMATIDAKSQATIRFQVVNEVKKKMSCQVKVDDGAWTFDNVFDFVLTPTENLPIVIISDGELKHSIKTAYDQEEAFKCQLFDGKKGNSNEWRNSNLAIVDQQSEPNKTLLTNLMEEVRKGKSMVLFTSPHWSKETFAFINKELGVYALEKLEVVKQNVEMEAPDIKSPFLSNMFERASSGAQQPLISPNCLLRGANEVLLKTKAGNPAMGEYWIGKGKVYVFSFALGQDETFSTNALFLPVFYRIAEKSSKNKMPPYIRTGDKFVEFECEGCNEDNLYSLQNEKLKIIPEQKLIGNKVQVYVQDNLSLGFWKVCDQKGLEIASFGLNANKQESDMSFYSLEELKKRFASDSQVKVIPIEEFTEKVMGIEDKEDPSRFWRYVVVISFLFLLLEIMIARYFKKITVAGA